MHKGSLVEVKPPRGARCIACAGWDGFVFLPRGDAALSRRAAKLSSRHAIVLKYSRARGRPERQGALVEATALAQAEELCQADAAKRAAEGDKRAVRLAAEDDAYRSSFARRILELFPRCPPDAARRIAQRACEKHSGRVGRTAAAKDLEPEPIELAVRAFVRHEHTPYDELLSEMGDRATARADVQGKVERVLTRWRGNG